MQTTTTLTSRVKFLDSGYGTLNRLNEGDALRSILHLGYTNKGHAEQRAAETITSGGNMFNEKVETQGFKTNVSHRIRRWGDNFYLALETVAGEQYW